jgi:phosphoribosyl-AMP cyclohydrolase
MQQRVVNLPEFNETTRIVETAKFSDEGVQATTTDDYTHYYSRARGASVHVQTQITIKPHSVLLDFERRPDVK